METNGYHEVKSEKKIFMKREGTDFIMHGLFVDDMVHIPACDRLKNEFLELYQKDFEITGGGLMETFLGMEVDQPDKVIRLHLDKYIRSVLDEYKEFIKKSHRPKRVPMSPGLVLNDEDCPLFPIRAGRSFIDLFSLSFNSQHHGFALVHLLLYHRWRVSAIPQVHRIGQHCIT
jgi:hypothetical protein